VKVLRSQSGLTLVEVLVAIALLAIVIVPAVRALQTSIVGANVHSDVTGVHYQLTSRMEQLLAEPFANLDAAVVAAGNPTTPSSYSEAPGTPGRLLVYLGFYDGDNADGDGVPSTGTDPDLIWIRVESEGSPHGIETITARGT
jgi:prepilin-type N-terminal cleavage/methylation domain-containing protein